jgi:outer membrane protein insertion porin family/translocation and assembly module TamA
MRRGASGALRLAITLLSLGAARTLSAQEIDCDPGDLEVRRLTFVGNRTFSDAELAAGIVTTPSGFLYRTFRIIGEPRCLDPVQLPLDSMRILVYYRNRGFYETTVGLDTTTVAENAIAVTFRITEGEPMIIESLDVTGLEDVPDSARIVRGIPLAAGQRFDQDLIEGAVAYLATALRNSGYPDASALRNHSTNTAAHSASVRLEAVPGTRARIGEIRIVTDTAPGGFTDPLIRRLLGLRVGDLYSAQRLLDAQRFLSQTGAFRHVGIGIVRDTLASTPDSLVTIQIQVIEAELRDVTVGPGWGTLDCVRLQGTFNDRNFFGGARQFELTARISKIGVGHPLDGAKDLCVKDVQEDPYSDTLNYRVTATLRQPGLFGLGPRNVPSITAYSERRSEYQAYLRSVPVGAVATMTAELRRNLSAALAYQLEYGRTDAEPAIYCAIFNICGQEERARVREAQRLAVASVTLSRDRQPAFGSGSSLRFDFRHASDAILSDPTLEFNTLVGDARRFWTFDNGVEIAARFNAGVVLGSRLSLEELTVSDYVPPQERLYAGGPNSVRGFAFNLLGPIAYVVDSFATVQEGGVTYFRAVQGDSTVTDPDAPVVRNWRAVPTGGNALAVANVEVRLPSPVLPRLLRYALFVDAGEVCNFELKQSTGGCTLADVRFTPGAGIRLASPVGPIRVDVAYNGYDRLTGVAYHTFSGDGDGAAAPLYCVSPGNTRAVDLGPDPPTQDETGTCGATWRPPQPRNFFQRLTFQFSIGEAF